MTKKKDRSSNPGRSSIDELGELTHKALEPFPNDPHQAIMENFNYLCSKRLPHRRGLRTCLRNIPVDWLNMLAVILDVEVEGTRQERELAVYEVLQLGLAPLLLSRVSSQAQQLFREIAARGGLAELADLVDIEEVAFDPFWIEFIDPETPLGELCSQGLTYPGTTEKEGQEVACVLIPNEILDAIHQERERQEIEQVDSLQARRKWRSISPDLRQRIVSNVFCGSCLDTTIVDYIVVPSGSDIVLKGKCKHCGAPVARHVEFE